ncbi:hypothetical protein [Spiroplasma phoeniceum]|uniref:Uncharacterized protein n=1 Tax=Spiroplasma phoeniceum P40 TaxID=1276259 RepID=A0A345DML0_9MOLU|nr:hypothetical protein [Spiroplasma phoeniceum]AXF95448.1 hypothetical protein SDAV_00454 [Spiroplasma phoeniceum P40]
MEKYCDCSFCILKAENGLLEHKIEEFEAEYGVLEAQNNALKAEIDVLETELAELKQQQLYKEDFNETIFDSYILKYNSKYNKLPSKEEK